MKLTKLIISIHLVLCIALFANSVTAKLKEIGRDRNFIAYDNGIVYDTKTGIEWFAGPDKDTNWYEADTWVKSLSLDGGRWRMPTKVELKSLYKKGMGPSNMTRLLKTNGQWVWAGETERDSQSAWLFSFMEGDAYWASREFSVTKRGFAVRFRK